MLSIWVQDKNRDVIVAFPDVDPIEILAPNQSRHHHHGKSVSRRTVLTEKSGSYEQPHLWYPTSEVIHALKLFLASANELHESSAFR